MQIDNLLIPFLLMMVTVTRFDSAACFSSLPYTSCGTKKIPSLIKPHEPHPTRHLSVVVLQSSTDDDSMTSSDDGSVQPSNVPPAIRVSTPEPVPPKILDPLMASLTRVDAGTANLGTRNIPFFGEVPADGSLIVLVPAAISAILGFALSIVIAFNSKDAIVATLTQVSDELSQTPVSRPSQTYDESVCRGICSSQGQDLEGLKTFLNKISNKN